MDIEVYFSLPEARKLRDRLIGDGQIEIRGLGERIARAIKETVPPTVQPWRKVVGRQRRALYWYEVLDCGHKRQLRTTKNWQENEGSRRRCNQCHPIPNPEAEG